jgi:hypothetical protein
MPCELKEKERMGVINPIFTCQPGLSSKVCKFI